jgi:hypothetical protein
MSSMPARIARLAVAAAALAASLALAAPAPAATGGLRLGFTDFTAFEFTKGADRLVALQRAKAAGASIIRVNPSWGETAPTKPPSLAAERDPAWPGYDWTDTDSIIRDVVSSGLTPLVLLSDAPRWAEGPNRPAISPNVPAGVWKPSAKDYGAFAEAAARRYSGTFPDPQNPGQFLPQVTNWQGWNEPNLNIYLMPQWTKVHGRLHDSSADIFRGLMNAFYAGIKAASPANTVVTAGTSPFGDPPSAGARRIAPARFWRDVFCLSSRLKKVHCGGSPVHFDVIAHHPYPIGPPRRHAPNPDDVVIADFSRITKPLSVALKRGTVLPRGKKQVWATEISWESKPPDPNGIPDHLRATYMDGAFNEMWSEGVNTVIWFNMRDQLAQPDFASTLQSGIFFAPDNDIADDTPKPSYPAYQFPFTAYLKKGKAELWGLAPAPGPVTIQVLRGSTWTNFMTLGARSDRLFLAHARLAAKTKARAVQGSSTSLPWTVFTPN